MIDNGTNTGKVLHHLGYWQLLKDTFSVFFRALPYLAPIGVLLTPALYYTTKMSIALSSGSNSISVIGLLIALRLFIGVLDYFVIVVALEIVSDAKPNLASMFKVFANCWKIYLLIVFVSNALALMAVIIHPAFNLIFILASVFFFFAPLMPIIDHTLTVGKCLKESYELGKGYRWNIFVLIMIIIASAIVCAALPVIPGSITLTLVMLMLTIATVVLYKRILFLKSMPLPEEGRNITQGGKVKKTKLILEIAALFILVLAGPFLIQSNQHTKVITFPDGSRLAGGDGMTWIANKNTPAIYRIKNGFFSRLVYLYAMPKDKTAYDKDEIASLFFNGLKSQVTFRVKGIDAAHLINTDYIDINGYHWTRSFYAFKDTVPKTSFTGVLFFIERKDYYLIAFKKDVITQNDVKKLDDLSNSLKEILEMIDFPEYKKASMVSPNLTKLSPMGSSLNN